MQVNNKYSIGEKVYFIDTQNKAKCDEVTGVFVYVRKEKTKISYCLKDAPSNVDEEHAFATESDLKEYVFKDLIEFV